MVPRSPQQGQDPADRFLNFFRVGLHGHPFRDGRGAGRGEFPVSDVDEADAAEPPLGDAGVVNSSLVIIFLRTRKARKEKLDGQPRVSAERRDKNSTGASRLEDGEALGNGDGPAVDGEADGGERVLVGGRRGRGRGREGSTKR